jgi:hypothetical protein
MAHRRLSLVSLSDAEPHVLDSCCDLARAHPYAPCVFRPTFGVLLGVQEERAVATKGYATCALAPCARRLGCLGAALAVWLAVMATTSVLRMQSMRWPPPSRHCSIKAQVQAITGQAL